MHVRPRARAEDRPDGDSYTFTVTATNAGLTIKQYTVIASDTTNPARGNQSATGTASPITIRGLTDGDRYTFTVTAGNAVGNGGASAGSNAVIPEPPVTLSLVDPGGHLKLVAAIHTAGIRRAGAGGDEIRGTASGSYRGRRYILRFTL